MKKARISGNLSLPVSTALSLIMTIAIMLLGVIIMAAMITNGKLQEENISYIVKIILSSSALIGVIINMSLQKDNKHIAAALITAMVVLIMLIGGISLDVRIDGLIINVLFVLIGSGIGILMGHKKRKSHSRFKKRYC